MKERRGMVKMEDKDERKTKQGTWRKNTKEGKIRERHKGDRKVRRRNVRKGNQK